jgi:hypothetical protein
LVPDLKFKAEKAKVIDALNTLQAATPQQKKRIQHETFLRWILPRINDRDPDGKAITDLKKVEIAHFCYDNRTQLYSSCPAMAVASELSKIRSRDAARDQRRPMPSR